MNTENAKIMLELSRDLMKDQADTRRLLTAKATVMIGIASLIVSVGSDAGFHEVGYICSVASMLFGLFVLWTRIDFTGPKPAKTEEILNNHDFSDGAVWVSRAITLACDNNSRNLDRASISINAGVLFLALASVLIFMPADWVKIISAWFGGW